MKLLKPFSRNLLHATALLSLVLIASCSSEKKEDKLRSGSQDEAGADGNGTPSEKNGKSADGVNTDLAANSVDGSTTDGQNFNLSVLSPQPKFISPVILATNIAQQFGITNWRPPTSCDNVVDTAFPCTGAEMKYCQKVWGEVTRNLFCKMGGEGRETKNFSGATFTSGDLVLLWQMASNICSYNEDPVNSTPVRLGVSTGQSKAQIADRMISTFQSVLTPAKQQDERTYIYSTFLNLDGDTSTVFSSAQLDQLQARFANACIYSVIAQHQWQY